MREWNRIKLSLVGDRITVKLNDVEVYQRDLESTNQRTFGLFRYQDETENPAYSLFLGTATAPA